MDNIINDNDMNEIELKTKIEGLEKAIQEHKADANRYEEQLKQTTQQLKDYNKPELTPMQLDGVYEAIESAVNDFDFDDTDNYHIEYELDYDGRVNAQSLELQSSSELIEKIVDKVTRLFKEVDLPETEECESTVTKAS